MSGSLFEWCKGLIDIDNISSKSIDLIKYCITGFDEIKLRIRRGGAISSNSNKCRITNREFDVLIGSTIFDVPFHKVNKTEIISNSPLLEFSIKKRFCEDYYSDEYYYGQNGLRLVLRNLTPLTIEYPTSVCKEDFNKVFVDEYGVIYSSDKKRLLRGPTEQVKRGNHSWTIGVLEGTYSIIPGTICICDRAFYNCKDLNTVIFPHSVRKIGTKAFSSCLNLSSVNLNDGLISIADDAFNDCKHLHSIILPESIKSVGNNVFAGCMIKVVYSNYGK